MKDLIKSLLLEGKTDEEIATAVLADESAKGLTADAIAEKIIEIKKGEEITAKLKAKADADKKTADEKIEETKAEKRIGELVDAKLKKSKVDPFNNLGGEKVKIYNAASGQIEEYSQRDSESIKAQGKLFKAMINNDKIEAAAISKDIDAQNAKAANMAGTDNVGGYAVATPVDNMIHELIYKKSVVMSNFNTDVIMQNDKIYPVMSNPAINWIANEDTAATQTTPAFTNPTTTMYRAGAFSYISNKLIGALESDIVNTFINSYSSAFARFLDAQIFIGNISGNSDLIDGLVWNANVNQQTAIALSALGIDDVKTLLEAISDEASNVKLFGNRKVKHQLGLDETTGGNMYFPQVINGGDFSPLGVPFIENTKITNVLDVGGDDSTGGTDTVIMAVDVDNVVVGLGKTTRISTSEDFRFTTDQVTIRGIKNLGYCTLHASGAVLQNLELTGAS